MVNITQTDYILQIQDEMECEEFKELSGYNGDFPKCYKKNIQNKVKT